MKYLLIPSAPTESGRLPAENTVGSKLKQEIDLGGEKEASAVKR